MQLNGLKSNHAGKLPAVKKLIHKKGNPKSVIMYTLYLSYLILYLYILFINLI